MGAFSPDWHRPTPARVPVRLTLSWPPIPQAPVRPLETISCLVPVLEGRESLGVRGKLPPPAPAETAGGKQKDRHHAFPRTPTLSGGSKAPAQRPHEVLGARLPLCW